MLPAPREETGCGDPPPGARAAEKVHVPASTRVSSIAESVVNSHGEGGRSASTTAEPRAAIIAPLSVQYRTGGRRREIGRASCRERVESWVGGGGGERRGGRGA